jgi:transposase
VSWGFELLLVNPQTVRALRGRKTDRIDARRIAEYLQYGLLHGSFVPPRPIRQWRDLTRMRVGVQGDRNRVINRIGRLLETVNIKLSSVASKIACQTGQAILKAIARGKTQPEDLASLALGQLKAKKAALALALEGRYSDHFRWLLGQLLRDWDRLDGKLAELDSHIGRQMEPHGALVERLDSIPGVDRLTAWVLIAELGVEMSQFPTAKHAASWAGLCPGNAESAGKRFSGKTRKGDRYLRRILVQNAWVVSHMKDCFLTAVFYRIAHNCGRKKAAVAVAHRILVLAYHIMRDGGEYRERGGDYFDRVDAEHTAFRLSQRLQRIGYDVVLTRRPEAAAVEAEVAPETGVMPEARTAPAATGRKRGRPCQCAERGLVCTHPNPQPAKPAKPASDPRPPASPEGCPRCHRWGIGCIHVRPRKSKVPFSVAPPESTA